MADVLILPDEVAAAGVTADALHRGATQHLDTLTACGNLADAYFLANKFKDAIPLYERALAGRERAQGFGLRPETPKIAALRAIECEEAALPARLFGS